MGLTSEQRELLTRLKADNKTAGFPFAAGPHWEEVNSLFDDWLDEEGVGDVIHQRFNDHYAGLPPVGRQTQWGGFIKDQIEQPASTDDLRHLLGLLLDEKGCTYHKVIADFYGLNVLHWDLLTACESMFFLTSAGLDLTRSRIKVLDLGGGWGRIGCVLRILNPESVYVQCDLPESLLISAESLPRMLREPMGAPVGEFSLSVPGIYFIPSQAILDVPDDGLDLVVNVASFQEMTEEQTDAYHSIVGCKSPRLYSLQCWGAERMERTATRNGWRAQAASPVFWAPNYNQVLCAREGRV